MFHSSGVCSNIIHLDQKKLQFYTGNYDMFVQTRCELLENQMKQYKWEQDQIANMKVRLWDGWFTGWRGEYVVGKKTKSVLALWNCVWLLSTNATWATG